MANITPTLIRALVNQYEHDTSTIGVARLHEARCAWLLTPAIPGFVLSAEHAACDASIVLPPHETILPTSPTDRLDYVLDVYQHQRVILPIDFKTFTTNAAPPWLGPIYGSMFSAGEPQRDVALFILANPAAPDWVIILPACLRSLDDPNKSLNFAFREEPLHAEKIDPLPAEALPFTVPIAWMGPFLKECIKFYVGQSNSWLNPYNRVSIRELTRPELSTTRVLCPTSKIHRSEFDTESLFRAAFKSFSTKYKAERLMIKPSVGDFQIVSLVSGERIVVEMKTGQLDLSEDWLAHKLRRSGARTFSPMAEWDYLFSVSIADDEALFASRDDLPSHWFTEEVYSEGYRSVWYESDGPYQQYILPLNYNDLQPFVRGVEAILDGHADGGSLRAQKRHEFIYPSSFEIQKILVSAEHP